MPLKRLARPPNNRSTTHAFPKGESPRPRARDYETRRLRLSTKTACVKLKQKWRQSFAMQRNVRQALTRWWTASSMTSARATTAILLNVDLAAQSHQRATCEQHAAGHPGLVGDGLRSLRPDRDHVHQAMTGPRRSGNPLETAPNERS